MEVSEQSVQKNSTVKIVIVAAIVIAIGATIWYFGARRTKTPQQPNAGISNVSSSTLGGTLYEKTNNPIQNKLPNTVAPMPNPLQNVYKNPFQ